TYLTLGWIGLGLLGLTVLCGYRNVVATYRHDRSTGVLKLALFAAALVYNISEAAFKVTHPVWIAFLLAIAMVPVESVERTSSSRSRVSPPAKAARSPSFVAGDVSRRPAVETRVRRAGRHGSADTATVS